MTRVEWVASGVGGRYIVLRITPAGGEPWEVNAVPGMWGLLAAAFG